MTNENEDRIGIWWVCEQCGKITEGNTCKSIKVFGQDFWFCESGCRRFWYRSKQLKFKKPWETVPEKSEIKDWTSFKYHPDGHEYISIVGGWRCLKCHKISKRIEDSACPKED